MPQTYEADFIVVGGGSAGCAVAGRLAEQTSLSVLLIEAGKAAPDLNTRIPALVSKLVMNPAYDWVIPVEPDQSTNGRPGFWPAGKVLGGGSAINGMMYIRGHADDYDNWARMGAEGWAYADCLPYFKRMESNPRGGEFHGSSGPMSVSESRLDFPLTEMWMQSVQAAGIPRCEDLNGDGNLAIGADYVQASQINGRRWSAADGYVRTTNYGGRLTVLDQATVNRVIVENGTAVGVELTQVGKPPRIVRARKGIVLSAGSLATPKLLMLSGIGPAEHLAEMGIDVELDLPGVGQNLQDHVGINLGWTVKGRSINTEVQGFGIIKAGLEYLLRRSGILSASIATAQAMIQTRSDRKAATLQLAFSPFSFDITPEGERVMPKESMVSMLVASLHPGARGSIRLKSADPADPPIIEHQLLGDSEDIALIAEGIELARKIIAQKPIADFVIAETKPGLNVKGEALHDWIRMVSMPLFHPIGTCRMGNDKDAVVSPDLKIIGLDGLWVADCSVAPEQVSANTNATAIMIGDKAANHILAAIS